jgi:hypothetical protein
LRFQSIYIFYNKISTNSREYPLHGLDLENEKVSVCRLVPADLDYQILIVHPYYARSVDLYLLHLDHEQQRCSVTDKQPMSEFPNPLVFDKFNRRRFILYFMNPQHVAQFQLGEIRDGKMELDKRPLELGMEPIVNAAKLEGNKAYALAK